MLVSADGERLAHLDPASDGAVRTVSRVVDVPDQPMVVTMGVPDGIGRIMRALLQSEGVL